MPSDVLQLAAYLPRSKANGPGVRSVLWVQGCPFRCPNCFNATFWSFTGGQPVSVASVVKLILADSTTEGISLSGGEPLMQAAPLAQIAEQMQAAGKGVLIFTGFMAITLETNQDPRIRRLLAATDLLVAGPYRQDQVCYHPLLASANQTLVHLSNRYKGQNLDHRRVEYLINQRGSVTITGFPSNMERVIK